MKKLSLLIVLLLTLNAHSQVGIHAGYGIGTLGGKDWKTFSKAYEKVNENTMLKSKLNLGIAQGYQIGLDLFLGLSVGYRMGVMTSKASAEFESGSRNFDLKSSYWYVPVGFYGGEGSVQGGASLGIGIASDRMHSYYTYWDGTESYGKEKYLNGVYTSSSFMIVPEAQICFAIPWDNGLYAGVFANLSYRFTANSFLGLEEKLYLQANYNDLSSLKDDQPLLPKNYDEFVADPETYDQVDPNNSIRKFSGLMFQIGIKITLMP